MRKFLFIPILAFLLTGPLACTPEGSIAPDSEQPATPDNPGDGKDPDSPAKPDGPDTPPAEESKTLVAYFSAQGHTRAVAERIAELTGADIYSIEPAQPYSANPYDDSDRIQNESYNNLRPGVANLPDAESIARRDTIFVGSPTWWHQPAMVVCTFLEAYDLKDKVIIPFFTYGATTYLNESMHKIYSVTPDSRHIPATLPEDLDPDDITVPGRADDAGIDMPGSAAGTENWLRRLGVIE